MAEKPCILIIEDDPTSRRLVSRVLSQDFHVITADDGLVALTLIKRQLPDLILTDINLPYLSGEIIASRILSMVGKQIPIVALTAQTDASFKRRALAAGCVGYITKPFDVTALIPILREYLNGRVDHLDEQDHKRGTQEMQADMTQQLEHIVRQLEEDNAELRNLERAKTAFLTQVSHELRTPMTVLSGYIQMLHQQLHQDTEITDFHRELSDMAIEGMRRLHILMNEIVILTRLASNELDARRSLIRIDAVALEAIAEYQQAFLERKILFESSGAAWSQTLSADPALIRMALSNLLSNAIKATPDGGKVVMSIEQQSSMLHISIKDSGIGIAEDHLPLLFKPFFTAIDVSRGRTSKTQFMGMGMGMGLTIVLRIIDVHKGQIWAESPGYSEEKLPGSTFHILLPLRAE